MILGPTLWNMTLGITMFRALGINV